jgi:tetratricopeptide (TPR) repeat protein
LILRREAFMASLAAKTKPARNRKKCLVPPPGLRDGDGEAPAALPILKDVDDDLGLALWRGLRILHARVLDFPDSDSIWDEERPPLAAEPPSPDMVAIWIRARSIAPSIAPALDVIFPAGVPLHQLPRSSLAAAADQVRSWCEAAELPLVAAYYAEAAAHADPESASAAINAARSCRRAVLYKRSAHWYQRGRSLAVRAGAKSEVVRALLGAGSLMYHLGYHARARHLLEGAKRQAVYSGRRRQAAEAEHDLLLLAAEERDFARGQAHAMEALRLYPRSSPRIPYFVHDYAHFLVRLRIYSPALPLLKAVSEKLTRGPDQALVWSTIARAAAGAGRSALFDEAVVRARALIERNSEFAAPAYKNLAVGAWIARHWTEARFFADRAVSIARERDEREPLHAGRRLRVKLVSKEPPPPPADPPPGNMIEPMQRRCLAVLGAWKPRL